MNANVICIKRLLFKISRFEPCICMYYIIYKRFTLFPCFTILDFFLLIIKVFVFILNWYLLQTYNVYFIQYFT